MSISKHELFVAIKLRSKIEIDYTDRQGIRTTRKIRPYHVFEWNRKQYFMGFCEYDNANRTFRNSRVRSIEILEETFNDRIPNFEILSAQAQSNAFGYRYRLKKLTPKFGALKKNKADIRPPLPKPCSIPHVDIDFGRNPRYIENGFEDTTYPRNYSAKKLTNSPAICRSPIELVVFDYLNSNPMVKEYWSEPIRIPYRSMKKKHHYIPDILVEYQNTESFLVEVKSPSELHLKENLAKYKIAQNYCSNQEGLAFQVWTVDDGEIKRFGLTDILQEMSYFGNTSFVETTEKVDSKTVFERALSFFRRIIKK